MSVSTTESCYDCGQVLFGDEGQSLHVCLWELPGVGEHWGLVQVCPHCGAQRRYQRAVSLILVGLVVSARTALLAFPLVP